MRQLASLTATDAIQWLDRLRKEADGKRVTAEVTLRDRTVKIASEGTRLIQCRVSDGTEWALKRELDLHEWKSRLFKAMTNHLRSQ